MSATLTARDPDALQAWYAERLGAEQPQFVPGLASPAHFAFHVREPAAARLELSQEYDFSSWDGARARYFRDPEENVGELIGRPAPLPELTLAEVGLPVEDVGAAIEALSALGIEPYRPGGAGFAPVGTREGLLVLVGVGRPWFPTETPAGSAPVEVVVADAVPGEVRIGPHRVVSI